MEQQSQGVFEIMRKMNALDWIAWILVLIGAINWGLIGFFKYNFIASIFGDMTLISRLIYALVGIAAVYLIVVRVKERSKR